MLQDKLSRRKRKNETLNKHYLVFRSKMGLSTKTFWKKNEHFFQITFLKYHVTKIKISISRHFEILYKINFC